MENDEKPTQNAAENVTIKDRLKDEKYLNWQKACHILLRVKPNLDIFIHEKATELHNQVTTELWETGRQLCKGARPGLIKKQIIGGKVKWNIMCKDRVCQNWVERISQKHLHPENIYWSNSKINRWPNSYWEVAKVFMGKLPKDVSKDAQDSVANDVVLVESDTIDVVHSLHFLSNCTFLHNNSEKHDGISHKGQKLVKDMIAERNKLMHNANMKIETEEVQQCKNVVMATMKNLLKFNKSQSVEFEKELDEIADLSLAVMSKQLYDTFLKFEATAVAAFLDASEEIEVLEGQDEEVRQANLNRVLKMINDGNNSDLKSAVGIIRNVSSSFGGGSGTGGIGMQNLSSHPAVAYVSPFQPTAYHGEEELIVRPIPEGHTLNNIRLEWDFIPAKYTADVWFAIVRRQKLTSKVLEKHHMLDNIKKDVTYEYRLVMEQTDGTIETGDWYPVSGIQKPNSSNGKTRALLTLSCQLKNKYTSKIQWCSSLPDQLMGNTNLYLERKQSCVIKLHEKQQTVYDKVEEHNTYHYKLVVGRDDVIIDEGSWYQICTEAEDRESSLLQLRCQPLNGKMIRVEWPYIAFNPHLKWSSIRPMEATIIKRKYCSRAGALVFEDTFESHGTYHYQLIALDKNNCVRIGNWQSISTRPKLSTALKVSIATGSNVCLEWDTEPMKEKWYGLQKRKVGGSEICVLSTFDPQNPAKLPYTGKPGYEYRLVAPMKHHSIEVGKWHRCK